jgi:hypothetical protein
VETWSSYVHQIDHLLSSPEDTRTFAEQGSGEIACEQGEAE